MTMVVKVYISGISGNKEVKKRQQRVLMILDSKNITYEVIDIAEPGREVDKNFMQNNAKSNGGTVSDPNPRSPLPPQVFNDEEYCGDYDQFDLANEVDTLEQFLKLEAPPQVEEKEETPMNGDVKEQKEGSQEKESTDNTTKEDTLPKEGTPAKEGTPTKEGTPAKEDTPAKADTPARDGTPVKESTPVTESTAKESTPVKEGSVAKEDPPEEQKDDTSVKENSPVKEMSPEKEKSSERQSEKDVASEHSSKETTPEKSESINENGTVSSRELSEEKNVEGDGQSDIKDKKMDNASEALIHSEQQASVE